MCFRVCFINVHLSTLGHSSIIYLQKLTNHLGVIRGHFLIYKMTLPNITKIAYNLPHHSNNGTVMACYDLYKHIINILQGKIIHLNYLAEDGPFVRHKPGYLNRLKVGVHKEGYQYSCYGCCKCADNLLLWVLILIFYCLQLRSILQCNSTFQIQ